MRSSTVARRDDVPVSGKSEKATFPSGQETSEVKAGDCTIGAVDDSARAGQLGSIAVDATITTLLNIPRLEVEGTTSESSKHAAPAASVCANRLSTVAVCESPAGFKKPKAV
jgi:hypothetical protein